MRHAIALPLLCLTASCGVAPMDAVRDFAAIHDPQDWRHRAEASMTVPPDFYFGHVAARADGQGFYPIDDIPALELAILDQVDKVGPLDVPRALEVSAWMIFALAQDEHDATRVRCTSVLLRLAGNWAKFDSIRAYPLDPNLQLRHAQMPDPFTTARVLAALGRLAPEHLYTSGENRADFLQVGLSLVVQALEFHRNDPSADVAEACTRSLDYLEQNLTRG